MKKACLLLSLVLLAGCEDTGDYSLSPRENFESLWQIIDEHYCFFEYKQIDWDEVHARYSREVSDSMDQYQLFEKMGDMLNELKDGHTNLISSFNVSRYWDWYEDYPLNFYKNIQKKYLGKSTEYQVAGGIKYRRLANEEVGYLYYESFAEGIGESNLDYVFDHFSGCKGLIIDVRNNGGGSLTNSDRIASRFIREKLLVGYIQHKKGKGHDDFSDPYPIYLSPSPRVKWFAPVVVLTNRQCYSATNDFVQKMRMIPHVIIMGDRTGGGSGFPFNSELPNGWGVRFSSSPLLDANKEHTEFGIDPDIAVNIPPDDFQKGIDTILEEAIRHLTEKNH
ncbi:S41 family peptidase [Parabacteroides sp. PF5-6]|uniref:S41 family peptidase n=1 Tax=Parabacteroides sp. PF5-6 TaxID=1742403 RepID=UPI0024062284|nr:S41 family peptidase [Parabacteroides sp. PF5-6]MDF9830010.1 C-terminal processing protease CtpA/Prc [Parabacteroides sp. PF5-6]